MRALFPFLATVLFYLCMGVQPSLSQGQEASSPELKANLDLPFDAGSSDEGEEEAAPETLVLYGQQYEGSAFIFCCEKTMGCDGGVAFRAMQKQVSKSISQLSDRVEVGLVFFNATMEKFPKSGRPIEASPAMKTTLTRVTLGIQPGSGCCPKAALFAALDFAGRSSARHKLIIYVGEGFALCAGQDPGSYPTSVLEDVRAHNTSRIPIHAIGTGSHGANDSWLKTLAADNNGTYRRIDP